MIDESPQPAGILTKPLQRREFLYKRFRFLGLERGVPPPPKAQPEDVTGPETTAQEPAGLSRQPAPAQGGGGGGSWRRQEPSAGHPGGPAAPGRARGAVRWRGQDWRRDTQRETRSMVRATGEMQGASRSDVGKTSARVVRPAGDTEFG